MLYCALEYSVFVFTSLASRESSRGTAAEELRSADVSSFVNMLMQSARRAVFLMQNNARCVSRRYELLVTHLSVSRQSRTVEALTQCQANPYGICGRQSGFPVNIVPPFLHTHLSITDAI